ncbi:VCBS repeat-containing protein [Lentzea sp. NPDC034063]|uniref:C40 family peptidase n=1 Tax=unclassified Lentzea TaxID=2643253 RepID=UPI0033C004C2
MKSRRTLGLGVVAALAALALAAPVSAQETVQGQGTEAPVAGLAAAAVDEPITRDEVISRAKTWLTANNGGPVPYDMGGWFGGYRADCSGFVSMAWKLGSSRTTESLPGVSQRIAKNDLLPGDVLGKLGPGTGGAAGHVVVFEAWANDARTAYTGIEQAGSPGHTVRRTIPYPYFGDSSYLPWRYNKIADTRPVDRVSDVNSDGWGDLIGVAANGELFGYNNATLVSGDRSPFTGETWRNAGSDWSSVTTLASGDVTGDGYADLVGVEGDSLVVYANGALVNPGGKPYGGVTWRYDGAWSAVSHLAIADVTGDGFGDLVAVERSGALVVYANGSKVNPGNKPFGGETWRMGTGWGSVKHLGVADLNRDGFGDLVAVDGNGELFGYNNATLVSGDRKPFTGETWRIRGSNWSAVRQFTVMDASGDGYADIIAVEPDGKLAMYANGSLVNPGGIPYTNRTWSAAGDWSGVRTLA